tara:strand:- start:532 stop:1305 length:774 start_codon:yes stop_codon:yes gene_type:complete
MLNRKYIILFLFSMLFSAESLAVITKSIGNVGYTKYDKNNSLSKLNIGSELFNEDFLETKSDGFIKFAYLDDGTTIKMHKNSEIFVRGDIQEYLIDKRISISHGTYNFNVSNQKDGIFTIITPTSVASVKGTKFILVSDLEGKDEFYGFEGLVEVLNKESNTTLRLSRNVKVTSTPDGNINSEIMTQSDYNVTNQINLVEEEIDSENIIPDQQETDQQQNQTIPEIIDENNQGINELRIKIKNAQGEEKELIIRYND